MLKLRAKVDILHVPYRGSADALNDLLAGNVDMMNEIVVYPHVKAGKLKLLAVNYPTRNPDFPDTPTLTEAGYPNADVPIWYSIWAPAATPREIIAKMNAAMIDIGNSESMQARLRGISAALKPMTAEELGTFFEADRKQIGELIKEANIRLE
jgi:tripartite-type tricarboxylate transporter receptor subunit TctC